MSLGSCSVEPFYFITQIRTQVWPVSLLVSLSQHRQPENPNLWQEHKQQICYLASRGIPEATPGQRHVSRDTGTITQSMPEGHWPAVHTGLSRVILKPFTILLTSLLLFNPFLPTVSNSTATGVARRRYTK